MDDREILNHISVTMSSVDTKVTSIDTRLEKVEECLEGNGKPGLKTDIALQNQRLSLLEIDHKEKKTQKTKGWWLAVTTGISFIIMSGAAIIKFIFS